MDSIEFKEIQHLRQKWFWTVLIGSTILFLFIAYLVQQENKEATHNFSAYVPIIITAFICLLLTYFFSKISLTTKINSTGIFHKIAFADTKFSKILWEDVENAEIISYDFVGYGVRFSKK